MAGRYDIDELLARVDLRQLADELLGGHKGNGPSARWPSPTPGHPQTGRTPPMTIRIDRDGRERFHCWATGARGTAIDLIGLVYALDTTDAITWLADRVHARGSPVVARPSAISVAPNPERSAAAIEAYVAMGEHWLWSPAGRGPLRYLTDQRGLDPGILQANRVGFDPGPRLETRALGLPNGAGITLPSFDEAGALVYVQTRALRPNATRRYLNPTSDLAKNPRVSWPKTTASHPTALVVTEGLIDALTVTALGYRAVAVLGASYIDPATASRLEAQAEHLILALDNDPAGQHARTTLIQVLAEAGREVDIWPIPAGHDLNSSFHARPTSARTPPDRRASRAHNDPTGPRL